jgi:hypothetical protein
MGKEIFCFTLVALFISCAFCNLHVLSQYEGEFKKMLHHRNIGDTSRAFSIAMKLLVGVKTLSGELEI